MTLTCELVAVLSLFRHLNGQPVDAADLYQRCGGLQRLIGLLRGDVGTGVEPEHDGIGTLTWPGMPGTCEQTDQNGMGNRLAKRNG